MEPVQVVWLVLILILVLAETLTTALVCIWFCAGALVAFLVALFWPGAYVAQAVAFLLVSVLMLVLLRPAARRLMGKHRAKTNAEAQVGQTAEVTQAVQPHTHGRAKLGGVEWIAIADTTLQPGTLCRVAAVEGTKLRLTPLPEDQQPAPTAKEKPCSPAG